MTEIKMKQCPLLVQSETNISMTIKGEAYTRIYFSECIGKCCAAYIDGECKKFNNIVAFYEVKMDKEKEE